MKDCVILLKDLLKSGICVEEDAVFEKSIFSDVYENAAVSVENIVQMNRENRKTQTTKLFHQEQEIANVVSFIGRRGTGKTSSMLSFCKALDHYRDKDRFQKNSGLEFGLEADMENVRFFCLDYIDASILEESEDIFILVLASMLNYLDNIEIASKDDPDYDYRWLLQKMEDVYKDFLTIKNSDPYKSDEYTSYERLRNIASSQRIRMLFQELVQQFLEYLQSRSKKRTRYVESYLVITLDDLDMAHYNVQTDQKRGANNKSFEIVNCIYKYLSIPGVIVLAAYNHVNLMQQCIGFFGNCDKSLFWVSGDLDEELKHSSRLADQFMDKAFPVSYRLYMPSWKKSDYAEERFEVNIKEGMGENSIFKKYCDNHRAVVSVKDLLLILYAGETGVYYDFEGKKTHFLEPDSLRGLKDTIALFGDMIFAVEAGEESKPLTKRKDIFKTIKGDLHFHFIQGKLYLLKEKDLFEDWMELRIDRRSEEIVRLMSKDTIPLSKEIKKTIRYYEAEIRAKLYANGFDSSFDYLTKEELEYFMDNRGVKYSFAELVHSIFHMTRTEKTKEKEAETDGYTKELVACILHSYSIYLSQLYDAYREEKSKLDKDIYINRYRYCNNKVESKAEVPDMEESFRNVEHYYDILKGVIGDTICGRWTEYFFPEVYFAPQPGLHEGMEPVNIGYVSDVEFLYQATLAYGDSDIKQYLREIIFVSMLHTDVLQWNHITCYFNILGNQTVEIKFLRKHRDDMELTAFMKYAFLYQDFLRKMEELLTEAIERAEIGGEKEKKFKCDLKTCVQDVFSELWDQFYENDRKNGSMMFPIHNFDYAYNLIKHLYMETKDRNDPVEILNGSVFFDEFQKMISLFADHLEELDRFYCIDQRERNFSKIFLENPCITLFKELKGNKESVKRIGNFIQLKVILEKDNRRSMRISPDE